MAPVHLRVFLSSPGDVSEERRAALEILEALPRQPLLGGKVTIEPVAWDDPEAPAPLDAGRSPQRSVNYYKPRPSECDLTVVILWSRLGTPLPPEEARPDGTPYESGTVWEFEDAITGGKPVYVYHRTEKPRVEIDDPQLQIKQGQYQGVKGFLTRFRNPDGSLKGGYHEYARPEDFESLLQKHVESYVRSRLEEGGPGKIPTSSRPLPTGINTAPRPPVSFVERPAEREALVKLLLEARGKPKDASTMALTTAFQGGGGFGKTTLAHAVCHDPRIGQAFRDAILWIDLGETPDLPRLLARQVELLTNVGTSSITDDRAGAAELRRAMEGRAVLVVLDDVWQESHARPFLQAGPAGAHLVTTRNQQLASGLRAQAVSVNEMRPSEATEMLVGWLDARPVDAGPFAALAQALGEWPLLLALAGAHLRELVGEESLSPPEAVAELRRLLLERGVTALDSRVEESRRRAVAGSLEVSLARLGPLRDRYLELGIFPDDIDIPFGEIERLWRKGAGLDHEVARDALRAMRRLSLFTQYDAQRNGVRLHDVVRAYLREQLGGRLSAVNAALLDAALGEECDDGHWASLPQSSVYLWRQLGYHLIGAGRREELRKLLLSMRWLAAKLRAADVGALLSDFDLLDLATDEAGRLLRDALRLAAHILHRHPEELPGQLLGRLGAAEASELRPLIEEAHVLPPRPWLRPIWPRLQAPGGPLIRTLEGHSGPVNAVAIAGDGKTAVSAASDDTLKVWHLASGSLVRSLEGHRGSAYAVAITSDGKTVVSGSKDHTLKVWDLASGTALRTLEGHESSVFTVAITPDGKTAVSGSNDTTVKVWDLASASLLRTLRGHQDAVNAVSISSDGAAVLSASRDHTLKIWDLASGTLVRTLEGHQDSAVAVAIAPGSNTALSGSRDNTLKLWDIVSGSLLHTFEGHKDPVNAVAITSDGRTGVSGSLDNTLKVWDLVSGSLRSFEGHQYSINALAITPDGRMALSGSIDGTLKLWDLGGASVLPTTEGHQDPVHAVAVTPDGTTAVSGALDNTLKVWDLASGSLIRTLEGHKGWVYSVAVTPDGKIAVSGSKDYTLKAWDLASGSLLRTFEGHQGAVYAVAITPDGKTIVSGSTDQSLRVWDLASGSELHTLEGHLYSVHAVAITPDGRSALSGSRDHRLKLWDLGPGSLLRTFDGDHGWIRAVAITPDGDAAVSGSRDSTLKVWDVDSGSLLRILEGHQGPVTGVGIAPKGRLAVSSSSDNTLKLWDLVTGRLLASFTGDAGFDAVTFTPAGTRIVAGDGLGRLHYLAIEQD